MRRERIRILYVIGTLERGGAEGQLVEMATRLDPTRFAVEVCCLLSAGPHAAALEGAGIPVRVVGFRRLLRRSPVRGMGDFMRLVSAIRAARPDIVHGFLFWAYVLGAFAARVAGVGVVVSSRRSLGNFKKGRRIHLALERIANMMTTLVIANSHAVKADAISQEGLPERKVMVIHNGVDLGRLAETPPARDLNIPDGALVVSVIANFIAYKGYRYFFDAWERVVRERPTAVCLQIGEGPERAQWERRTEEAGLSGSVRFLGSRGDVPAILAATDLVVHPSLEEGFSNAILEAMAAGKPVVATSVGGNVEAVQNGVTGLLVEPRNADQLAAAMSRLLDDPALRSVMGVAARRRVEARFEMDHMIKSYESVYERLIHERPRGWARRRA